MKITNTRYFNVFGSNEEFSMQSLTLLQIYEGFFQGLKTWKFKHEKFIYYEWGLTYHSSNLHRILSPLIWIQCLHKFQNFLSPLAVPPCIGTKFYLEAMRVNPLPFSRTYWTAGNFSGEWATRVWRLKKRLTFPLSLFRVFHFFMPREHVWRKVSVRSFKGSILNYADGRNTGVKLMIISWGRKKNTVCSDRGHWHCGNMRKEIHYGIYWLLHDISTRIRLNMIAYSVQFSWNSIWIRWDRYNSSKMNWSSGSIGRLLISSNPLICRIS